ncbi:low temperature requirement protein A [Embleya hyalina]|uniref:Low temperature requirement protein A n=1 Tax=Embleya hyalina TaxID=516124 RepID=A0A401YEV3_9ACTN|nr:low temperature requirement protein A [Embleya hyalina]GCD93141.1 hypothetical protein EHYA_00784 [Embleya hyalina]
MSAPVPADRSAADDSERAEQRATWTELFFDLVVVAGVAQLAHLLHDPSPDDVALYALLYPALWIAWTGFTVRGSVEGERAAVPAMLVGMLGMAVLASSVADIRDGSGTVFILAYVALRWFAGHLWQGGAITIAMDWPLAQLGIGTTPWLISLWVDAPARYGLWALGLVLDFLILFTVSGTRTLGAATRRVDRLLRRRADRERTPAPSVEAAYTNTPHLAERLGLYVIIVLGEGVSQVVSAASDTTRDPGTLGTALGAFALLVGVWSLSLLQGFAGIPHLRAGVLPLRRTMLLHGVSTGLVGALAAGLGVAVAARGAVPSGNRWLLCGAVAAWECVVLIGDLTAGRPSMGTFVRALPGPAVALGLSALGDRIGIAVLVWVLAAIVIRHVLSGPSRRLPAAPAGHHPPSP